MLNFILLFAITINTGFCLTFNCSANEIIDSIDLFRQKAEQLNYEGDYIGSLIYLNRLLKLKNIEKLVQEDLAKIYFNLASNYLVVGDYCNSVNYLNKAESIYSNDTIRFNDKMISIFILKGIIYFNKGDYKRAEFFLNHAIRLLNTFKNFENDENKRSLIEKRINAYNAIASVYYDMKDYEKSLYFYKKAEEISHNNNDLRLISSIKINIANVALKLGNFKIASKYYEESVHFIFKLSKLNYFDLLSINNYLLFLMNNHYFNKAKLLIDNLNKYRNQKKLDYSTGFFINNIFGNYYFYQNNKVDSSIYFFSKALDLCKKFLKNSIDINYLNNIHNLGKAYYKKYLVSGNVNDLLKASDHYRILIDNIEKLKNSFLTQESKIFLMENEYTIYLRSIEILLKLAGLSNNYKYNEEAFYISEKLKSSILYNMIKDNEAKVKANLPDSILQKENEYKRLITVLRELIYEEQKSENPRNHLISKWESKIMEYEDKYEKLLNYMENNFKKYYNLKYNNQVISIKEVQKKINNDVILDYVIGDTMLYTFVITKKNFFVNKIDIDNNFFDAITKIYSIIGNVNFSNNFDSNFVALKKHLFYLYKVLLKPYEKIIEKKHIIIIPDNILYYIPFEILLTENKNINVVSYKDLPYLIKNNSVSYEYSCRLFLENRTIKNNKFFRPKVALFAPNYNGRYLSRYRSTRQYNYRKDLLPIPGALKEVKEISRMFSSDIYSGNKASEKNFKMFAGKYDILHFAMHTIIDNENPMYSKLVFSEPEDTIDDGFLNAYELYNLNLRAKMVVLSSCNSGKGSMSRGEGIISISRGFLYAGSSSLLLTLWEIEDAISSELMVDYYRYLKRGYTKDKALQFSKLNFINKQPPLFSNPFYWTPYVIYGNESSICIKFYYIPVLAIVLILFSIFFLVKKHKW